MPAALLLFSPWLDLSLSGSDQRLLETRDPVLKIQFLRRAGKLWAGDLATDDPRVSPLFADHKDLPPTVVFSGSRDVLDSDALRLAAKNPDITHYHYAEMMHVWPAAPIPEGRRALDQAAAFVRQQVLKAR
jgi:acetyl esterase/lipase